MSINLNPIHLVFNLNICNDKVWFWWEMCSSLKSSGLDLKFLWSISVLLGPLSICPGLPDSFNGLLLFLLGQSHFFFLVFQFSQSTFGILDLPALISHGLPLCLLDLLLVIGLLQRRVGVVVREAQRPTHVLARERGGRAGEEEGWHNRNELHFLNTIYLL